MGRMIAGAVGSEGMRFMNIFTGWGDITRILQLPPPFRSSFVVLLLSPRFAVEISHRGRTADIRRTRWYSTILPHHLSVLNLAYLLAFSRSCKRRRRLSPLDGLKGLLIFRSKPS